MARKFLYIIAGLIVLVIAVLAALRIWSQELTEIAFVPSSEFIDQSALEDNAYDDPDLWYSRPGKGLDDPARWQPAFRDGKPASALKNGQKPPPFAVFFVHPTSYIDRSNWNAKFGDKEAERIARIYLRGMASPFAQASEIWAPRYRQATLGAMITDEKEGQRAIDAAYRDVESAFAYFLKSVPRDTPIVLAGHSQGALHVARLLTEKFKGKPIAQRLIAAYIIGWPLSIEHDLPAIGFPACTSASQTGCIASWSSYAEPADPSAALAIYSRSIAPDGQKRGDSPIVCTNPLTGTLGGAAPASDNLGTLVPKGDMGKGELVRAMVPARCDPRGILLIGEPRDLGRYVLPGNNYHVYDIPLFWANTRADVARRAIAWKSSH